MIILSRWKDFVLDTILAIAIYALGLSDPTAFDVFSWQKVAAGILLVLILVTFAEPSDTAISHTKRMGSGIGSFLPTKPKARPTATGGRSRPMDDDYEYPEIVQHQNMQKKGQKPTGRLF